MSQNQASCTRAYPDTADSNNVLLAFYGSLRFRMMRPALTGVGIVLAGVDIVLTGVDIVLTGVDNVSTGVDNVSTGVNNVRFTLLR
jgi:hypothetical protein